MHVGKERAASSLRAHARRNPDPAEVVFWRSANLSNFCFGNVTSRMSRKSREPHSDAIAGCAQRQIRTRRSEDPSSFGLGTGCPGMESSWSIGSSFHDVGAGAAPLLVSEWRCKGRSPLVEEATFLKEGPAEAERGPRVAAFRIAAGWRGEVEPGPVEEGRRVRSAESRF